MTKYEIIIRMDNESIVTRSGLTPDRANLVKSSIFAGSWFNLNEGIIGAEERWVNGAKVSSFRLSE